MSEEPRVSAFLERHAEVIPFLNEALEIIPRYFGPDASVRVEIPDEEGLPDSEELYALIETPYSAQEELERLDRFDRAWWHEQLPHVGQLLTVSLA